MSEKYVEVCILYLQLSIFTSNRKKKKNSLRC